MNNDWLERTRRLESVVGHADVVGDHALVKSVRLSNAAFAHLKGAVISYVWHSLVQAFPDIPCLPVSTILADYMSSVVALPNRTPNGVLLPRSETCLSFNLVHQALSRVIDELGMATAFSHIQVPCNVRIVEGTPDKEVDSRPYASSKIHTDVWAGEPLSSILFNIPVLGDPEAVDLEFFEPEVFPSQLMRTLPDYDLGRDIALSSTKCPLRLEMGTAYISDALSLHKTAKRRASLRLSIDFRCIARNLLPGESSDFSTSRANYVTTEAWRSAGSTMILTSGEPLDGFQRKHRGEKIRPTEFSLSTLSEISD